MALPPYVIDANPFAQSFNALGQGVDQLGAAMGQARKREQGQMVTNALASGDYAGAMRATDSPELAMNIRQQQSQAARYGQQDANAQRDRIGKFAMAASQLPAGPGRDAAFRRVLSMHPDAKSLPPEYLDPARGLDMIAAEFGQFRNPLDDDVKRSQLAQSQAQLGLIGAQTKALGQKDALNEAISGMIRGDQQPAAPPQPMPQQQGQIIPQSFDGGQPMPGVQLVNDPAMPHQRGPQAPQPVEMVDTPLGRKTPEEARRLAFALSMAGKGDAGKMLADAAGPSGRLPTSAQTENDKDELAATGSVARLQRIKKSFDPSFLTFQTQGDMWGKALIDKAGLLKPDDQQKLNKYTSFRRDAASNINRFIKDMTGATVTEGEATRLMAEVPNAGSGMFDGDSPTQFKAKLDKSVEASTLAIARSRYLRSKGFTGKPWEAGVAIEDMEGIINQRGAQIQKQLQSQNPKADPMQLDMQRRSVLKQEFGI